MSNQHNLQTPRRSRYNPFDDDVGSRPADPTENRRFTITPCTGLSRMTINSQSNGSRMAPTQYQFPATSLNDKLMQVAREEQASAIHPNLDMYLKADKISIMASYSEDEESDEGESFSSSLCLLSPPECSVDRRSLFDDELMRPPSTVIFDDYDDYDDDYDDDEKDIEYDDVLDSSSSWLGCIYQDPAVSNKNVTSLDAGADEPDDENRPPRHWHSRQQYEKKIRRTSPQDEENAVHERIPLREILVDDYFSDTEDVPANKKMVLEGRKPHKLRFMRALSPPKYISKNKGKQRLDPSLPASIL